MEPQWHAQAWFLDAHLLVADFRELFRVRAFNLSVAVWVGFLALFVPTAEKDMVMRTAIVECGG